MCSRQIGLVWKRTERIFILFKALKTLESVYTIIYCEEDKADLNTALLGSVLNLKKYYKNSSEDVQGKTKSQRKNDACVLNDQIWDCFDPGLYSSMADLSLCNFSV